MDRLSFLELRCYGFCHHSFFYRKQSILWLILPEENDCEEDIAMQDEGTNCSSCAAVTADGKRTPGGVDENRAPVTAEAAGKSAQADWKGLADKQQELADDESAKLLSGSVETGSVPPVT